MLDVLVYLKRDVDIASNTGFKDAIVSAVAKGRADGKSHFGHHYLLDWLHDPCSRHRRQSPPHEMPSIRALRQV
jgi:hypothetical protein